MFILNPPYTLEAILRETMPYLVQVLGQDAGATFRIEKGTQVTGAVASRGVARQPVGNARRASPLSGGGSLRLPGQAFGDGPRGRTEGEGEHGGAARAPRTQGEVRDAESGRGARNAAGPRTPRAGGRGARTEADGAAKAAPRGPFKRRP
jgi:23S rRNA (adenine2030-N6)-methyltransferase